MIKKIAILGDFNPIYETHHRLNESARDVQRYLSSEIQFDWMATDVFDCKVVFEKQQYCGVWIAPGSPYRSMENVLAVIKYARENNVSTMGNCGGFQHMIIEFAKNVCGIESADHEETNPDGAELLITKLACSLKGQQENLNVIDKSSLLYKILQAENLAGKYYCSYGINKKYVDVLMSNGIRFTTISEDGNYRSFEIDGHLFFVGTLFQPALTSTREQPDPLIIEFVRESMRSKTL